MMPDERFMQDALMDAEKALSQNEFPVGCVLTYNDQIIARGGRINSKTGNLIELDHAEIVALRNLQYTDRAVDMGCVTLYSTMEPCLMCYGTLLLNGIRRIVYAYEDVMGGGTGLNLGELSPLYREMKVTIVPHVLRAESLALHKLFFNNPNNHYWKDSLLARYTLEQK